MSYSLFMIKNLPLNLAEDLPFNLKIFNIRFGAAIENTEDIMIEISYNIKLTE